MRKHLPLIITIIIGVIAGGIVLHFSKEPRQFGAGDATFEQLKNVTKKGDLYKITFNEDWREQADIEIKDQTIPEAKLRKWGDETYIKIDYPIEQEKLFGFIPKKIKPIQENGKLKWKNGKKEVHLYPTKSPSKEKADALEFEVVLKEKPASNVIKMNIETKGLKFYYQPPLNEEEKNNPEVDHCTPTDCYDKDGNVIIHRPENVVGSYAVYHESKAGDYSKMGKKNYRAGKAFHIYRPKITDANGNWTWGKLNIDKRKGILTIEIDQNFLNKAVYPVKVDPTFGNDTVGGSEETHYPNDLYGSIFTSPSDAQEAESLTFYVYYKFSGKHIKGVLVLESNKTILNNGVGSEVTIPTSANWITSSFSTHPSLSGNTGYVLMVITDSYFYFYYDSVSSAGLWDDTNSYTSPTDPTDASTIDKKFSIYCTYTAGGGGEDTCTPPASGDWFINSSDNCYITSDTYINGDVHLVNTGAGGLHIINNSVLACKNLHSNGVPIYVKAGSYIKFWTPQ